MDYKEAYLELLSELQDVLGAASEVCDRINLMVEKRKLTGETDNYADAKSHVEEACDFVINAIIDAEEGGCHAAVIW